MHTPLCDGIDSVGFVDWNARDFHGYHTPRGATYNAYLVRDEKTALIDAVKAPNGPSLLENVVGLTDPASIDYVVCNHAEPDHSGGFPEVMAACPHAEVVCNAKCRKALELHYDTSAWRFRVVKTGETLSLGERSLTFVDTPMAHWPESMATYVPEEKLLFSMDIFGQHYASSGRFDDEEPLDVVMEEAKTYYANILMLYGRQVARALDRLGELDIETIAPSHGVIWRRNVPEILAAYRDWSVCRPQPKVLVVYDTIWESTARMARAIVDGATRPGVEAKLYYIRSSSLTVLATEMLDTAVFAFGCPAFNNGLMPQAAAALTYLQGLSPAGKAGLAFGSYGWKASCATRLVEQYLDAMKVEKLCDPVLSNYAPTPEVLEACRAAGALLADAALERAGASGAAK